MDFDVTVDVLVVGGGAAGLAAAAAAAQAGAKVLLVEKGRELGGTTRWAIGSVSAAGTRVQNRAGIDDDPEDFAEDMAKFRSEDVPELRRLLAHEAAVTVDWLEDLGVVFSGPFPEPPHRVPRMHNVIPHAGAYLARLAHAAREAGARITVDTRLVELVVDAGEVVGARVRRGEQERTIRALGGVILATGDFSGNAGMRAEHLEAEAAAASPINPDADGSGHQAALAVGAATREMGTLLGPQLRFPSPPKPPVVQALPSWPWLSRIERFGLERLPRTAFQAVARQFLVTHMAPDAGLFRAGAILVNRDGERFCTETESTTSLALQPGGYGYLILDGRLADLFDQPDHPISTAPGIAFANLRDYRRGRPDLWTSAPDLAGLASELLLDGSRLAASAAEAGLGPGPFVALGPVFSRITLTEGSLAVDDALRVLDEEGRVIEGLRAVGGIGQGGMVLAGHGHHLGWALTSGRVAGRLAAGA